MIANMECVDFTKSLLRCCDWHLSITHFCNLQALAMGMDWSVREGYAWAEVL
jgi:hypothetical protein